MDKTIKYIQNKIKNFKPELGIILGSGLGDFADNLNGIRIKYSDIPGFETSTVSGHKGQLVFAEVEGKKAVIMQGRYHYYEGYHISRIVYPIKVMKKLGVKNLIVTNAAGSVNKEYNAGDLMIITDNFSITRLFLNKTITVAVDKTHYFTLKAKTVKEFYEDNE